MDNLPHKGQVFAPWPHEPPEGWPYEYVAKVDHDALAARLAEAERLLLRIEAHKLPFTDTSGPYWKLPLPLMREVEAFRTTASASGVQE
jgi:hypothetical protein